MNDETTVADATATQNPAIPKKSPNKHTSVNSAMAKTNKPISVSVSVGGEADKSPHPSPPIPDPLEAAPLRIGEFVQVIIDDLRKRVS